ncbi:MAG: methionyl-tRNA formyltransferase [Candidatus Saccharibacteria bacterium]|nr:methionyl-tRNA formyltransferase [Candidatus Saccharibacteria bacterium]
MTQMSNQLVFFGTEDFSAAVLERLINAGLKFEAVITKPDSKKGRGQKLQAPIIKTVAQKYDITVFQPHNVAEMRQAISQTSCLAGVLVSFGKIIPQDIIDSFKFGIINLHPSLLPKYRGPSPIETALLNGDDITGITVISLNSKMDAGPIYAQEIIELTPKTTANDLYQIAINHGSNLLIQSLPRILSKNLQSVPQEESQASYCNLLTKSQSQLNPEIKTAQQLVNQIRAFQRFPKSRITIFNQNCVIVEATADDKITSPISFECVNGSYLNITQLVTPSGKIMTAKDFINGHKS